MQTAEKTHLEHKREKEAARSQQPGAQDPGPTGGLFSRIIAAITGIFSRKKP
jgi:hypothetical protein